MKEFFEALKDYIEQHPLNYGDGESVLSILYGKYLGEDPLEFEEKDTIEDFVKGGKNE